MGLWIKDFISKLLSNEIEYAYKLKHRNLPKKIYKYRAVNKYSLENLQNNFVWLSDPKNFNDPYDCTFTSNINEIIISMKNHSIDHFFNTQYDKFDCKFSEEELASISKEFDKSKIILKILSKRDSEKEDISVRAVYATFIHIFNEIDKNFGYQLLDKSLNRFKKEIKVCSFSELKDSLLMWAHYANNHKGFCLEFDLKKRDDFKNRMTFFMYPVIYKDELYDITEFNKESLIQIKHPNRKQYFLLLSALFKSTEWKYEKEWRIIIENDIEPVFSESIFPMPKPSAIYLGTKINSNEKEQLIQIANDKKIDIYQMELDKHYFKLHAKLLYTDNE